MSLQKAVCYNRKVWLTLIFKARAHGEDIVMLPVPFQTRNPPSPKILLSVMQILVTARCCCKWEARLMYQIFMFENTEVFCEECMIWIRDSQIADVGGGVGVRELMSESPGNFFKNYKCPNLTTDLWNQCFGTGGESGHAYWQKDSKIILPIKIIWSSWEKPWNVPGHGIQI